MYLFYCTYVLCVPTYLILYIHMYLSRTYVRIYVSQLVCTYLSHCVCMYVYSLYCTNSSTNPFCPCNLGPPAERCSQPKRNTCHGWSKCAGVHSVCTTTSKVSSNCCNLCSPSVRLIFICYFVAIVCFHFDSG